MAQRCDVANTRLFVKDDSGVYRDVKHRCMKPTCEICWKLLLNRRTWATRLAMAKVGVNVVWLGLITDKERAAARRFKHRAKNRNDRTTMNMLTTYQMTDVCGLFATCDMLPNHEEDTLVKMSLEEGLSVNYRWATEFRPKRVMADWDLKLPSNLEGKFTATQFTIAKMWKEMGERWGYKPGEAPDDPIAFERRMYLVIDELRNPDKYR